MQNEQTEVRIKGLKNGLERIKAIDLLCLWVSTESVDSQYNFHPEIEAMNLALEMDYRSKVNSDLVERRLK
jgi:hypothetical protein